MSEVRQRWRVVFARDEEARYLSHLDAVAQWERALRRGGVPLATTEGFTPRPRIVFGAPLPLGMTAEHELADLFLAERLTATEFRRRVAVGTPPGYRVLQAHDIWAGAPALAPQLAAADYRLLLLGAEDTALSAAAARLMAADRLPRERRRESKAITYDLRPLLIELRTSTSPAPSSGSGTERVAALWMRLRHSQEEGSGRPDEVAAAIAELLGMAAPPRLEAAASSSASTRRHGKRGPADAETVPSAGDAGSGEGGRRAINGGTSGRGSVASDAETGAVERGTLEVLRAVRERMWLAEELESRFQGPPAGKGRSQTGTPEASRSVVSGRRT